VKPERSSHDPRQALRANPYFANQAKLLRWLYLALFATAANGIALTLAPGAVRSNLLVILWTVALGVADFALIAKWLPRWRRMWQEQNRLERRTSSDRAASRLAEILGAKHISAKVSAIGVLVAIALIVMAWRVSAVVAVICAAIALGASSLLAWSLADRSRLRDP
jgi:hypothetical protein